MSSQEEAPIDEHQQKLKGIKRQMTYANGMLEHELETASQNIQSSINRNNSFTLKPDSNHVPVMKDASAIENKYLQVESDNNQALHVLHRSEEIENLSFIQSDSSLDSSKHLKRTPEVENLNELVET
jgi:hypothetical protein